MRVVTAASAARTSAATFGSSALAQAPATTCSSAARSARRTRGAANRHHQGGGHRERLHLPLRQPSGDVHRHAGRRDRDRPDRLRPAAGGQAYVEEIRKITKAPIKYLIYSHHHLRPHRGRQAVQGGRRQSRRARRAKERLSALKGPTSSSRTRASATKRTIKLGGTRSSSSTPGATIPTRRW